MSAECKYNEEVILKEIYDYVMSTYQGHYVGKGEIQTFDVWDTLGIASELCQGTALKYIMRLGKKEGYNKKDILKAIHYLILLVYFLEKNGKIEGSTNETHNGKEQLVNSNKR